jgi:hypothetical protein
MTAISLAEERCDLLAVRAGLLHPRGRRIAGNRAGCMRNLRDGGGQTEGRKGGKDQILHFQFSCGGPQRIADGLS